MRSRTELVTTQLEGSEFEDESDFEDSEEDWQPAKGEQKPKKVKSSGRGRKSAVTNKNGAKKRGRKPSKKSKKKSSDEDNISDDDTSEPESTPARKPRKTPKKPADSNVSANDRPTGSPSSQPATAFKPEPTTSMLSTAVTAAKPQPLQRKIVTPLKSFPDKCGYLNLFIFKGDLKDGIVNNAQVCLWRRDGSSLLQKYLRDKTVLSNVPQFNSSMVYSCWEDRRADEYLEVKVRCLEQSKQIRVELTDVDELEAKSKEEYETYVSTYGTPVPRSSKTREGNSSNDAAAADGAGGDEDDDDDDECDEDDIMDEAGDDLVDGEGEEYEEEEEEEDETEEVPQEE
ncbi:glutamic acid-rich protein [Ochlerotatus camptorhynchus]|uniref:glutamic acid-rich protein n=1 Tax=Ochlerotatus camptorhynchus TaxID=644619 RepID=UPI0031D98B93